MLLLYCYYYPMGKCRGTFSENREKFTGTGLLLIYRCECETLKDN